MPPFISREYPVEKTYLPGSTVAVAPFDGGRVSAAGILVVVADERRGAIENADTLARIKVTLKK